MHEITPLRQNSQIRRENKTFNLEGHTKAKPTRRIIILGHNQVNERLQPHKKLQGNIFSSRPQPTKIPTHVRNYSQPQPSEQTATNRTRNFKTAYFKAGPNRQKLVPTKANRRDE